MFDHPPRPPPPPPLAQTSNRMSLILKVFLSEGKDFLPSSSYSPPPQLFILLRLGSSQTHQTHSSEAPFPSWQEEVELNISPNDPPTTLFLECWQKDSTGGLFLGEASLLLKDLFQKTGPICWETSSETLLPVKSVNEEENENENVGFICLKSGWINNGLAWEESWWKLLVKLAGSPEAALEISQQPPGIAALSSSKSPKSLSPVKINGGTNKNLNITVSKDDVGLRSRPSSPLMMMMTEANGPKDLLGVIFLDIVSASNLHSLVSPTTPSPNAEIDKIKKPASWLYPFLVLSFSRNTFRTKCVRQTDNPVWNERIVLQVRSTELSYPIKFSIYNNERIAWNNLIATAQVSLSSLLADVEMLGVDEETGEEAFTEVTLPLNLPESFAELSIRALFCPYTVLRRRFWIELVRQYDIDGNEMMNKTEVQTMLDSLGSNLDEEAVCGFFYANDLDPTTDELDFDQLAQSLEQFLHSASSSRLHLISITECPLCRKPIKQNMRDEEVITHVAICAVNDPGKADRILLQSYVTEDYAQRKWFAKLLDYVSCGSYQVGKVFN